MRPALVLPCALFCLLVGCSAAPVEPSSRPRTKPEPVASEAPSAPVSPPPSPPSASASPDPPGLEPLAADSDLVELPVQGHEPAVVSLPLGVRARQPLIVATHGAGGRAVTHCRLWRHIVGDRGIVLCPRGRSMYPALSHARGAGYYYPGHPKLAREMTLALAALRERYGPYLDDEGPIFAGYSQGASMGALVLPDHDAGFSRAALVEGGVGQYQEWNLATARRFEARGGRRVLMVCGRPICHERAQRSAELFERVGVEARVIYAAGAGHTYGGEVQRRVMESFSWLVEDDARWERRALSPSPTSTP